MFDYAFMIISSFIFKVYSEMLRFEDEDGFERKLPKDLFIPVMLWDFKFEIEQNGCSLDPLNEELIDRRGNHKMVCGVFHKKTMEFYLADFEKNKVNANVTAEGNTAFITVNHYDYNLDEYTDLSELILVDISDKYNPYLKSSIRVPSNSWGIYHNRGIVYLSSNKSEDEEYI